MTLETQERLVTAILWAVKIIAGLAVALTVLIFWVVIAVNSSAGDLIGYLITATTAGAIIAAFIALDAEDTIRHTRTFAEAGREPLFTTKGNFIALGALGALYLIFLSAFVVGAII